MEGRRHRKRWIAAAVALLGLGIAGALLWPRPTTVPAVPAPPEAAIPEGWSAPAVPDELPPEDTASAAPEEPGPRREALPVGYVQTGRIVYELEGRRVAEETYRLERRAEGVELASSGSFSVRVLFITVTVTFTQAIALGGDLGPRTYRLEARGPLGFGTRRVFVSVAEDRARVAVGDEVQTVAVPSGNAFFLGTPAAYVLLPALHGAWAEGDGLVLVAVGTGGGPGAPAGGSVGEVEVTRQRPGAVEAWGGVVFLDRYRVQAGGFGGTLLARDLEFVAFLGEGGRAFTAYRADLFPRGVRLLP